MFLNEFITEYHTHIFIWLGIFIFTIIVEAIFKKQLVAIWFSLSAGVSLLFALLKLKFAIQFIAFFVIAIILILLNEFYFKKRKGE